MFLLKFAMIFLSHDLMMLVFVHNKLLFILEEEEFFLNTFIFCVYAASQYSQPSSFNLFTSTHFLLLCWSIPIILLSFLKKHSPTPSPSHFFLYMKFYVWILIIYIFRFVYNFSLIWVQGFNLKHRKWDVKHRCKTTCKALFLVKWWRGGSRLQMSYKVLCGKFSNH